MALRDEGEEWAMGRRAGAVLGLAVLLLVLARVHTYDEPFQNDLTLYAVSSHELLQGRELYSQVWDHKPVGITLTYAAAEMVAGFGEPQMFLLSAVGSLLCLAGLVWCTMVRFPGPAAGGVPGDGIRWDRWAPALVGLLWAVVSGDCLLEGNQANTELFQNGAKLLAFGLFLRCDATRFRCGPVLGLGLLCAAASLYKQVAVVFAVMVGLAYLAYEAGDEGRGRARRALGQVLTAALVAASCWGLVVAWFALTGRFEAFWDATVIYNMAYSGGSGWGLVARVARALSPDMLLPARHMVLVALFALWGMLAGLRGSRSERRATMMLVVYAASQVVEIGLQGRYYSHYYQVLLPPLVLGAVWALPLLVGKLPVPRRRAGALVAVAVLVGGSALVQLPWYLRPSETWAGVKYSWQHYAARRAVARRLATILRPDETLYQWGEATGLYFHARRRPPTGVLYSFHAQYGPLRESLSRRILDDLTRKPPDLVVVADKRPFFGPVPSWILDHYLPLTGLPPEGRLQFLGWRGSRLCSEYGGVEPVRWSFQGLPPVSDAPGGGASSPADASSVARTSTLVVLSAGGGRLELVTPADRRLHLLHLAYGLSRDVEVGRLRLEVEFADGTVQRDSHPLEPGKGPTAYWFLLGRPCRRVTLVNVTGASDVIVHGVDGRVDPVGPSDQTSMPGDAVSPPPREGV